MFKNVASSFMVFAFDSTTNLPKTGDAANITAYVSKDYGTVTVLADTSATEMDATNAKGYYLFAAAQGETNGDCLMVSAKSATSNIVVVGAPSVIYTRPTTGWLAPTTAARTLDVSAGGEAGVDWANVGSPTTTVGLSGTTIKEVTDVETTLGTIAGYIDTEVAAIKTKTDFLPSVTAGAAGGLFIAGTNAATSITTALTANIIGDVTGNLSGSIGSVTTKTGYALSSTGLDLVAASSTGAQAIVDAVWDEAIAGHLGAGSTGLALNSAGSAGDPWSTAIPGAYGAGTAGHRLGALPDVTAGGAGGVFIAGTNAATTITTGLTTTFTGNLTGTLATAERSAIADALLDRDMSTGTDSGSTTVRTPRQALRFLRNKWGIIGTNLSVKKEDDSTESWSSTVTGTAGADPITANDPAGP